MRTRTELTLWIQGVQVCFPTFWARSRIFPDSHAERILLYVVDNTRYKLGCNQLQSVAIIISLDEKWICGEAMNALLY